jgi:hypothetical protein
MGADEIDAYLDFFEEKIVSKEKVPTRSFSLLHPIPFFVLY